jgi:type IV pilus assembly protein PilW
LFCTATDPTPAYVVGSTTWLELVPGVENMQILYGVDTDGDRTANVYLRASDITSVNQDQIVSARFSLLLRSPTEISPIANNTTYVLNGVTVGSNPSASASATAFTDRRVRRVVDFTVNLRNRTP